MRQTEHERVDDPQAGQAFEQRTLRAIRVVAEKAPPEEARRALRAIDALAREALGEATPGDERGASG